MKRLFRVTFQDASAPKNTLLGVYRRGIFEESKPFTTTGVRACLGSPLVLMPDWGLFSQRLAVRLLTRSNSIVQSTTGA